jgi:hypothetical protein
MNNQQSTINELHTGIFTFTITLYNSYCQLMPKEEAKQKVVDYIRELADYFEAYELTTTLTKDTEHDN